MSGERYYLTTAQGRAPLDGKFRRGALVNSGWSANLVRGRNQTEIFDLSDGLPDPQAITLTGRLKLANEDELSVYLQELEHLVKTATALDREGRDLEVIQGGSVVATVVGDNSGEADITITLIPKYVRQYQPARKYFN